MCVVLELSSRHCISLVLPIFSCEEVSMCGCRWIAVSACLIGVTPWRFPSWSSCILFVALRSWSPQCSSLLLLVGLLVLISPSVLLPSQLSWALVKYYVCLVSDSLWYSFIVSMGCGSVCSFVVQLRCFLLMVFMSPLCGISLS